MRHPDPQVRVGRGRAGHRGQVVELDAQTLAEAVALGWADPAPEAVAYAATLPINQPPA